MEFCLFFTKNVIVGNRNYVLEKHDAGMFCPCLDIAVHVSCLC